MTTENNIWPEITAESRPWTRWWWLGAAVDKENITRLMETYHQAGLGGVEITSIYGVKGQQDNNIEYLSSKWLDMVNHTISEAERLCMVVDMPHTSGWRTGGSYITDNVAAAKLQIERQENKTGYTARVVPSGELVKRAGPGGTGKTFNPFSRKSLQVVMDHFTPSFKDLEMRAQFHDSWEYESNACPEMFNFFKEKRGYDLNDHLTDLVEETENHSRIKYDVQLTLAEMAVDCLIAPWTKWCHELGQLSRNQAHGSPGNWLDLYAAADIPETESYRLVTPDTPLISKFASSAAHVAGKPLVSSETGTWVKEHFHSSLADLKYLFDILFVSGINHNIYHGTAYSPADAAWPGWLFYASAQLNPQNSIWRDFGKLNEYATRCQSILQNGEPDNQLLVYFPIHDILHNPDRELAEKITIKGDWLKKLIALDTFRQLWQRGYSFDYISDRQIADMTVNGNLLSTTGNHYQAIVVPPCQFIPVDTLEKLNLLSQAGGNVFFLAPEPADVPGFAELESRRERFKSEIKKANIVRDIESALAGINLKRETLVDCSGLFLIRRRHAAGYDYFVINQNASSIDEWISLSAAYESVLLMDPMTGKTGLADIDKGTEKKIRIQLEPGASLIIRALNENHVYEHKWSYLECGESLSLNGPWKLEFIAGGPKLPAACEIRTLSSWTGLSEEAARFAGTALYRIEFDLPFNAQTCLLDLGEVHSSARVRLNDKDIDTLIGPVFKTVLNDLKPFGNVLEIEVTNLSANRIRDLDKRGIEWKIFEDINFIDRQGGPFDAAKWPIVPSGLLGPVQLIKLEQINIQP